MRKLFGTFLSGLFLASAASAMPMELVENGGFETGDLSGWSCVGADLCDVQNNAFPGKEGSWFLVGFDNSGFATLSQTLDTVAGAEYDLSFLSGTNRDAAGNILRYQVGDGIINTVNLSVSSLSLTLDSFTATSSSTNLSFFFETDSGTGTIRLDSISVVGATGADIPAPAPLAMLGLGLLGLGAARRRKAG